MESWVGIEHYSIVVSTMYGELVGIEHYSIVVATMYGELVGIEHYSIVVATMYGELGRDRTLFHCSGYNAPTLF